MTSMVGLAFAMPAFAAPSKTSETFPQNGQMQEDTKYIGQATETNLHSYEGPVTATANYTDTPYTVTAGNYLPMSSETVAQCTSGNYCPGINGTVNYSTSANQGLTACPNGYGASDLGASEDTQCYRSCNSAYIGSTITSTPGIAHADGMAGNDYYGTGTDTCYPTSCVAGWHLRTGNFLQDTIGRSHNVNSSYAYQNGTGDAGFNQNTYGITQNNEFVVDFGEKGKIHGYAKCSNVEGTNNNGTWTNPTILTNAQIGTEAGRYCYCHLDSYTPAGNDQTMQSLSLPWVFHVDRGGADACASDCAYRCVFSIDETNGSSDRLFAFREAVFGLFDRSGSTCDANVISITWDGADQTDIDANNAGQCTYGGDINTPKKAVHVPGKTFVGWTFDTPSGN